MTKKSTEGVESASKKRFEKLSAAASRGHARREEIADRIDTFAKGAKVAAGIAALGAAISVPFFARLAPWYISIAAIALTLSAGASFYVKLNRKDAAQSSRTGPEHTSDRK